MGSLTRWDHVRAALLAIALLVHGIAASPMPKSVKRSTFDTEIAKEELDRWVHIFEGIGVTTTREALADGSFAVGAFFAELRGTLLTPFRPWFRVSGTGQAWGLFTYPDSFPHQLVIETRVKDAPWTPVYAALEPDQGWEREMLAYRRVRGVYDGNTRKAGASYTHFVAWIGARVLADHPEADEARVGFIRTHSVFPWEEPDPEHSPRLQRVVSR